MICGAMALPILPTAFFISVCVVVVLVNGVWGVN